ncbi:uncharacterized protein [Oscarella lobularis]|uniref:uncharacterized protein isoform X2 n=1 Tax=Oscarella lobularis TaxID=121494 RepID=UPI003313DF1D
MAAANSSGEGDDDVAASYQEAFERMLDAPNRTEILGEPSDTPNTSRIRRSKIYWKVLKKRVGSHDKIEEQRFAIKFTRYEEPIREREREALDAMDGHDNILTRHGYKRYPPEKEKEKEKKKGGKFTVVYQLLAPWKFSLAHDNLDETLREFCMSRLDVLKGLVKGLDFLASRKAPIVHRGISPEAILICKNGDRMTTKIADFDLAKRIVDGNASAHTGSGIDDWKPPDKEATVKYDIFGAGLIFHYVLTNGNKASHGTLYKSATAHLVNDKGEENELNFSELNGMITERQENPKSDTEFFHLGAFRHLISRMLSRYPDKRPSAEEVGKHCALFNLEESEGFFRKIDHYGELKELDSVSETKENWAAKLDECFSESLKHAKKADKKSQSELARFVRNRITHFGESGQGNPQVNTAFDDRVSLLKYFLNLFPYLMHACEWKCLAGVALKLTRVETQKLSVL